MSLSEIQRAVDTLSQDERLQLTAWMVTRYPLLQVEDLMTAAAKLVEKGQWTPSPPTDENRPQKRILEHSLRVAEELDLGK